jgi:formylglycine-generating enzyme required for sulfatase activity
MHGNVWEWIQDKWDNNYEDAPTDGSSRESGGGFARVIRGGSWNLDAGYSRSAYRDNYDPGFRCGSLGFRLLRIS